MAPNQLDLDNHLAMVLPIVLNVQNVSAYGPELAKPNKQPDYSLYFSCVRQRWAFQPTLLPLLYLVSSVT